MAQKKEQNKNLQTKEDKEKILEEMVSKQLVSVSDLKTESTKSPYRIIYQKLYLTAMQKNNLIMAEKAVKRLLPYTKNKSLWLKTLIDLDLKLGKFSDANKYATELIKLDPTKENLKKFLYVKFQITNFFDDNQVKDLKKIINILYQKGGISADDLAFYNFLINLLSKWNVKSSYEELNMILKDINNPDYKNLFLNFKKDFDTYKNSKGSPDYYLQALIALDLLKFWYFWLAKNIASKIYIEDSSYILPLQILAYSYFYMGNYNQAIKYFKQLLITDNWENDYKFFIWISYYWLGDYEKSLLYLSGQNKNHPYYLDILRYRLLDYIWLDDSSNIIATIKQMLNFKLNYIDYYNIFKYLLFKCKDCYKDNLSLIIKLSKKCYYDVDKNYQYVCWYGKWNLFLKYKKTDLAVKYFKLLSQYFQDTYIWDTLAKYYEAKKDYKKARYYYLKELLYTSNPDKRQVLKKKIRDLFLLKK